MAQPEAEAMAEAVADDQGFAAGNWCQPKHRQRRRAAATVSTHYAALWVRIPAALTALKLAGESGARELRALLSWNGLRRDDSETNGQRTSASVATMVEMLIAEEALIVQPSRLLWVAVQKIEEKYCIGG